MHHRVSLVSTPLDYIFSVFLYAKLYWVGDHNAVLEVFECHSRIGSAQNKF